MSKMPEHLTRFTILAAILLSLSSQALGGFVELEKLRASDGAPIDLFGQSVAINGSTAIIGADLHDAAAANAGAAYIFRQSDETGLWSEFVKLTASDAQPLDRFGTSVAICGSLAVIGASLEDEGGSGAGAAYVFKNEAVGGWTEVAKLTAGDANEGDQFGVSVAISGLTVVVGAISDNSGASNGGSAYVFQDDGEGNWAEMTELIASDPGFSDSFGISVAISGSTILVGAEQNDDDGDDSGSAYIFQDDGEGNWSEIVKLTASDAGEDHEFGGAVAIDGPTAVIGAFDDHGDNPGFAYIFERDGLGAWNEVTKLTASDGVNGDQFGKSVGIDGLTVVIGADEHGGDGSGAVYIFEIFEDDGLGAWTEIDMVTASDATAWKRLGGSVAISGFTVLAGATGDAEGGSNSGAAYVFVPDADMDADGDIDGSDFLAWQRGFGITSGATQSQGDANGDGAVDGADLDVWQSQFGNSYSGIGGPVSLSVPESSTLSLLLVALVAASQIPASTRERKL